MSRNFELLQNLGREQSFLRSERVYAAPSDHGQKLLRQMASADPELSVLARRLFLTAREEPELRVVMFCGVGPNCSQDRLCARVAVCLAAQVNRTVCLADSDYPVAALDEYLCVPEGDPVEGVARGISGTGRARQLGGTNLAVLEIDSGCDLSEVIAQSLRELLSEFDYVLINGPNLPDHGQGIALARVSDGVVLIMDANSTRRETAMQAKVELEEANVPVLGVVLNNNNFNA
jgi:protein-tyrosine kinase